MVVTHRSTTGKIAQRTKEMNRGRYFFCAFPGPVFASGPLAGRPVSPATGTRSLACHTGHRSSCSPGSSPHRALRYEIKIRTPEALSTTIRKRFGWIQKDDGKGSDFVNVKKRNRARLIAKVWKNDPELSPDCGSSAFKTRQTRRPDAALRRG